MNSEASTIAATRRVRRTQAQRTDSMRKHLIEATLLCLAEDGYARTTIGQIVKRSQVSHGAIGHHFASKNELIVAAAETLVRRTYKVMGELMLGIAEEENRLEALVKGSWERLYSKPMMRAYLELTIESQRDKALASALQNLSRRTEEMFEMAVDHYFERRSSSSEIPQSLFMLLQWLLIGMSTQTHLTDDKNLMKQQLDVWTRMMGKHLLARRGVSTPPPRPPTWVADKSSRQSA